MRWGLLLLLAACGARLDGGAQETPDGAPEPDTVTVVDTKPPPDVPPDVRPCTGGTSSMQVADGSCVVFFSTPKNFADADADCIANNSRLAILNTAERDAAAKAQIGTLDVWLGLSDQNTEGTFVWVDGTPLVFDNFATTPAVEPNNANGMFEEDCVMYSGTRGGWDDRPCSNAVPNIGTTPTEYAYLCMF